MKAMSSKKGFTQVPNYVLTDTRLSFGARLTYAILLSYAWNKETCFPGQKRVAEGLGVSDRTVRTYLHELEEHGLISWKHQGPSKPNLYTIRKLEP
jgi:hypothetical protein